MRSVTFLLASMLLLPTAPAGNALPRAPLPRAVLSVSPDDFASSLTPGVLARLITADGRAAWQHDTEQVEPASLAEPVPAQAFHRNLDEDPEAEAVVWVQGDYQLLLALDRIGGRWTVLDSYQPQLNWRSRLEPRFLPLLAPDRYAVRATYCAGYGTGLYETRSGILVLQEGRWRTVLTVPDSGYVAGWGLPYERVWECRLAIADDGDGAPGPRTSWPRDLWVDVNWQFHRADALAREYPARFPDLMASPRVYRLNERFSLHWDPHAWRYRSDGNALQVVRETLWSTEDPRLETLAGLEAVATLPDAEWLKK